MGQHKRLSVPMQVYPHTFRIDLIWKRATKHGCVALRLHLGSFVLNDIPMFHRHAVSETEDISRDPIRDSAESREAPMENYEISRCDDQTSFVLQSRWK
jgi:hypothetical protein